MPGRGRRGKLRIVAIVLAIIISTAAFVTYGYSVGMFSLQGGFQGQQQAVWGVQFTGGNEVPVGGSFSAVNSGGFAGWGSVNFNWVSTSVTSPELNAKLCTFFGGICSGWDVSYKVDNVVAQCEADNLITAQGAPQCPVVEWNTSSGTLEYGWIVEYLLGEHLTVSSLSGATFGGISWINEIASFYWNQAYSLNNTYQGDVFQAPLYAVISHCDTGSTGASGIPAQDCSASNPPGNDQISPMDVGSQISLYTDPTISGSWNDLGCTIASNSQTPGLEQCASGVQSSLSSVASPSSALHEGVSYFPITMQNFGSYSCGALGFARCYPFVDIQIQLYTLLIGSFIKNSVNPNTITGTPQGGGSGGGGSSGCFLGVFCVPSLSLGIPTAIAIAIVIIAATASIVVLVLVYYYSKGGRGQRK